MTSSLQEWVKAQRIIWLALVLGVVNYGIVVVALIGFDVIALDLLSEQFIPFFALAAVGIMLFGIRYRRTAVAAIEADSDPKQRAVAYQTACIVGWAITEGAGLMVVTVAMMASSLTWVGAGAGATVAALFLQRPDPAEVGLP